MQVKGNELAKNIYLSFIAVLNGFTGGAVFVIVPLFLTEIAIDRYAINTLFN